MANNYVRGPQGDPASLRVYIDNELRKIQQTLASGTTIGFSGDLTVDGNTWTFINGVLRSVTPP